MDEDRREGASSPFSVDGKPSRLWDKIKKGKDLVLTIDGHRAEGKKVVFTNGCYDQLHIGHIRLLEEAKTYGDTLVVAINSDHSTRSLKGESRPLVPEEQRAELLAALEVVDYVTIFDEADPLELIRRLRPDVLLKGRDWTLDTIVGGDLVKSWGGTVVVGRQWVDGISTTNVIRQIIDKYGKDGEA
jgi:D-beta-D-heptose 7-phosphate kinase/D-beta-D-heptose 1-phosphate adenosyltransferase